MNIKKSYIPYITMGVIALLMIIILIVSVIGDKKGPTITVGYTDVIYVPGMDVNKLLEGVSAYDKKDGDVSKSLLIDSVIVDEEDNTAKVIYAAKDNSGNITFAYKIIKYSPDGSLPGGSDDENPTQGPTQTPTQKPTEGPTQKPTQAPTQAPTQKPTQAPTQAPTQGDNSGKPVLTLKETSVTVKKGESLPKTLLWYVKDITDDKDDRNDIFTRIYIDGMKNYDGTLAYDLNTVGTYKLYYYTKDTDNNYSDKVLFEIIVVE